MGNSILWPREQLRYINKHSVDLFVESGAVNLRGGSEPFVIPDDPTWAENPFSDRSWGLYYNSLGWLYAAEEAFKQGRFPDFPDYAKTILLDWMEDNPDPRNPTSEMAWRDGTVAFRTSNISYLYEHYFKPDNPYGIEFSEAEQTLFSDSLANHLDQLQHHLVTRAEYWSGSNHRFFHAMGQASYASVFSQDTTDPFYEAEGVALIEQALAVVEEILDNIINIEQGVTKEQSMTYHRLNMSLLLEVYDALNGTGYDISIDVESLLQKMQEFDVLSNRPGNGFGENVLEIGDTYYSSRVGETYIRQTADKVEQTAVTEYVMTEGQAGTRPNDLIDYSDAGYIIIRPEYKWENERDMRVVMDVSEATPTISHGHYDNTNVLFSAYGEYILVDSGGPYSYSADGFLVEGEFSRTVYFIRSRAHNVVTVDGKDHNVDTIVNHIEDHEDYSYVSASHHGYEGVTMTRHLVTLKDGVVITVDNAENHDGELHDFNLHWHVDPNVIGLDAALNGEFQIGDVFVDTAFSVSESPTIEIISGRKGVDAQGWVAPNFREAEEAPVLELSLTQEDAWFTSAFAPSLESDDDLTLVTSESSGRFGLMLEFNDQQWFVDILPTNEINVTTRSADDNGFIISGQENDRLVGDITDDWIYGGSGDDHFYGFGGHDILLGDAGNDRLDGYAGNDSLFGGDGNDILFGLDGQDYIDGGSGNDRSNGGNGDDLFFADEGDDLQVGGAGDDLFHLGQGTDRLHGDEGLDQLIVAGARGEFLLTDFDDYTRIVDLDSMVGGDLGRNYLYNIEEIVFDDVVVIL